MLDGDRLALARLITRVENRASDVPEIMRAVHARTGRAYVLGITGPPGAGKSTLVDRVTVRLRAEKQPVGVIAVDPSSPFTGGAVLGDRIRMQTHTLDPDVFIRSMATRGSLGGLESCETPTVYCAEPITYSTGAVYISSRTRPAFAKDLMNALPCRGA